MATLANNSTGNFTTAATWSLVDATSLLDSETNTTTSTTAFVSSSTFTPGALTVDGLAIKVSARNAAPSGTFSVRLFNSTLAAAVAGTTVTINVSDIVAVNTSTNSGWVFFKFAAPVLLVAVTNYTVQITSSVNAQVTLYRDATAANWSRFLRTTTTQAPAAADVLYVLGDRTGAGTGNSYTVTMNNTTSATTFGEIQVAGRGTLDWGVAASTNYYLKIAGNLSVYNNGIYQQGTSTTVVPSTSTAKLEFANTSNVQFGVEARAGSTVKSGGAVITNTAFLAADAAAAATALTTDVSTGWKSGDVIALASTTRTRTEAETKALTANASGTSLTITALTNAHSGTSPTRAELANLTRNVQIFGTSTAFQAYINCNALSTVDLQSTEFYNMGSATANKRGIEVATTTGSFTANNCSIHDFIVTSSQGVSFNSASGNNYNLTNCVMYNIAASGVNLSATTGTTWTVNNVLVIAGAQAAAGSGFNIGDLGGTLTNLTGTSCQGAGISLTDVSSANNFGTVSGLIGHSNSTVGVQWTGVTAQQNNPIFSFSTITSWRNTTIGLQLTNSFNFIIDTVTAFGNATNNIQIGGTECDNIIMKNMTIDAGTTLTCPIGFQCATDMHEFYIDSSTFGGTTTHATGDIAIPVANVFVRLVARNTSLNSSTQVSTPGNMVEGSSIGLAKLQTTAGNHKTFKRYGTITPDTVIFNNASPSVRMTPNLATQKLQGGIRKAAAASGQTVTVSVWVRKSVAGDGAAYNGNQPRLILKADPATGITSDTVLATASAAAGTWEKLTATTAAISDDAVFQFQLDCDGTAGWVNSDDWEVNS